MSQERTIGVIGGSGLYEIEGLTHVERRRLTTPFGDPSDEYVIGRLGDAKMVFLPRHGRGHRILPHEINFRANIHGMKQLGVQWILSVSAVGSMKEEIKPGDIVIVDQFIDRTKARAASFFGDGVAGHVAFADPICAPTAAHVYDAAVAAGARVHKGGTYVVIEGPMFSTRAESRVYRSWGVDVIGMTNLPEARLAREAELPYATLAMVTDYDCWHHSEESVNVATVLEVLERNVSTAQRILHEVSGRLPDPEKSPAHRALEYAVITAPNHISGEAKTKLGPLCGRLFNRA